MILHPHSSLLQLLSYQVDQRMLPAAKQHFTTDRHDGLILCYNLSLTGVHYPLVLNTPLHKCLYSQFILIFLNQTSQLGKIISFSDIHSSSLVSKTKGCFSLWLDGLLKGNPTVVEVKESVHMWSLYGLCCHIQYLRLSLFTVLHMEAVFHCLLGTILHIKWRMFAT